MTELFKEVCITIFGLSEFQQQILLNLEILVIIDLLSLQELFSYWCFCYVTNILKLFKIF